LKKAYVILKRVQEQEEANRTPIWSILLVALGYPVLVFILGMFPLPAKLFGLPTLVFIWGFFGGYVAVIFRHLLAVKEKWNYEYMWLWTLIRPFLGAIMGAVLYFAVYSAVLLFSTQIYFTESREVLQFLIAFVGGVSEKVWDALIPAVLGPVKRTRKQASESQPAA
jgi:hypothetical protein